MTEEQFNDVFAALNGKNPFPWQCELYKLFADGKVPKRCNIPTGLGKTSVIAIWLIALAEHSDRIPRRLVYVVNRRTVVDQTTDEVQKLRERLSEPRQAELCSALKNLCAIELKDEQPPLALSTLRGQFADNRQWSADPARPAVIAGTVDMIGSRLLFNGYGVGFKGKPLHAGFLGQDALLVHDEAHLEPAFQKVIETIEQEQREGERVGELPWRKLQVMALTATSRNDDSAANENFGLTDVERDVPTEIPDPPTEPLHIAWRRLKARKGLSFFPVKEEKKHLADAIVDQALSGKFKDSSRAIVIFARTVENVEKIFTKLKKHAQKVQQLTGTLRGLERDELPTESVFARFLPASNRPRAVALAEGTVYLICTSAGEVGVNLSADHLLCDLTTFESMAQRFGRVNRFGDREDTEVHIFHPDEFDEDDEYDAQCKKTLAVLRRLNGDGSPSALARLDPELRTAAFAPEPVTLPVTDILLDSWCLTTIREKLPGRPRIEPYLHGLEDEKSAETYVAWREEVWELRREFTTDKQRKEYEEYASGLLDDYPLKPHELLRDSTYRKNTGVRDKLARLATQCAECPVWIQEPGGTVLVRSLADLPEMLIVERTVILPPRAGGLRIDNGKSAGMLEGSEFQTEHRHFYDVADAWLDERGNQRRVRVWDDDPQFDEKTKGMRLIRAIESGSNGDDHSEDESLTHRCWHWYVRPRSADDDGSKTSVEPVLWDDHTNQVTCNAEKIAHALGLPDKLQRAIRVAAKFHDLGKKRVLWQRSIGNPEPRNWLAKSGIAKSGKRMRPIESTDYRHEFGSLVDVRALPEVEHDGEFQGLSDQMKDVALHLIAAHHGRARPHFPLEEILDEDPKGQDVSAIAAEIPRRFARLQLAYGRWGLAYLESILRAADYAASAAPATCAGDDK